MCGAFLLVGMQQASANAMQQYRRRMIAAKSDHGLWLASSCSHGHGDNAVTSDLLMLMLMLVA